MPSQEECRKLACDKVKEIFGKEYLDDNNDSTCLSVCQRDHKYCLFVAIKSEDQCPHMQPNELGWCVYAEVNVDRETGEVVVVDYQTEEKDSSRE